MTRQSDKLKICLIGAGNVAWHLAPALARVGFLAQVASRSGESALELARRVNACQEEAASQPVAGQCEGVAGIENLMLDADLYLIAASDDAIAGIAASTPPFPGVWAHTSGSVGIDVFAGKKERYGSFYPLQTFSKEVCVDMEQVPFFIEGSDPESTAVLMGLAGEISRSVTLADSSLRRDLHIAAVFACNFVNQLWVEADALLRRRGLDISCMVPLIQATAAKIADASPADVMTGPARRGDTGVIRSHIESLPQEMRPVYRMMSERILQRYHPDKANFE